MIQLSYTAAHLKIFPSKSSDDFMCLAISYSSIQSLNILFRSGESRIPLGPLSASVTSPIIITTDFCTKCAVTILWLQTYESFSLFTIYCHKTLQFLVPTPKQPRINANVLQKAACTRHCDPSVIFLAAQPRNQILGLMLTARLP